MSEQTFTSAYHFAYQKLQLFFELLWDENIDWTKVLIYYIAFFVQVAFRNSAMNHSKFRLS